MGSMVITALLTVRLATGALNPDEFGLWSFTTQSVGYFLLLDFGVSSALGRMFGEPLASGNQRSINSWFTLAVSVLVFQGLVVLCAGMAMRGWVIEWFNIPQHLRFEASRLWLAFLVIQAVNLPLRITSAILFAQNRAYWGNLFPILSAWVGLAGFFFMIKAGSGVMAYAWSSGLGVAIGGISGILAVACGPNRFGLSFSGITWRQAKELFSFASSVFVVGIAIQILFASQALIITKMLGLAAGAMYAVTSRLPLLGMQVLWKPFDAFSPRWQAAHCAGDCVRVRHEFTTMFRLTLLLAFAGVVGIVLVNPVFVKVWTKPEYYGGDGLNILLGLFIIMQTFAHCLTLAFNLHKRMRVFTLVVFMTTGLSVAGMILLTSHFGLPGIPAALVLADLIFAFWFYVFSAGRLLGIAPLKLAALDIVFGLVSVTLAVFISLGWESILPQSSLPRFGFAVCAAIFVAFPVLLRAVLIARSKLAFDKFSKQPSNLSVIA